MSIHHGKLTKRLFGFQFDPDDGSTESRIRARDLPHDFPLHAVAGRAGLPIWVSLDLDGRLTEVGMSLADHSNEAVFSESTRIVELLWKPRSTAQWEAGGSLFEDVLRDERVDENAKLAVLSTKSVTRQLARCAKAIPSSLFQGLRSALDLEAIWEDIDHEIPEEIVAIGEAVLDVELLAELREERSRLILAREEERRAEEARRRKTEEERRRAEEEERKRKEEEKLRLEAEEREKKRIQAEREKAFRKALEEEHYLAVAAGKTEKFDKPSPAPKDLSLKRGAQVMILKNDKGKRWMNGDIGMVEELGESSIKVRTRQGLFDIGPEAWTMLEYDLDKETNKLESKEVASFAQFPLKLAWAATIHKMQGQTVERISIDLDASVFDTGMTYVALSRCRTMEGIRLNRPLTKADLAVDETVAGYLERLREKRPRKR